MRQEMFKMNNMEKANNSYQSGIQMRDQFYRTSFVASQATQPISFEVHRKEFLQSKWNKPTKPKEEG